MELWSCSTEVLGCFGATANSGQGQVLVLCSGETTDGAQGTLVVPGIETWSQLKQLNTKALSLDLSLASILREINQ